MQREFRALVDRIDRLERAVAAVAGAAQTPPPATDAAPTALARAPAAVADAATSRQLAELSTRLANLEAAQRKSNEAAKALAQPDSIPAALAVLLAARGVVTKVGDIEAIQQNLPVLAAIAADGTASDWDRIEAYRGMLMFGFGDPQACIEAMPGMAQLLTTSSDAKARRSAAAMLRNYRNPAIADTLIVALQREQDPETRGEIVESMLQLVEDPGVRQAMQEALRTETSARIRKLIESALQ